MRYVRKKKKVASVSYSYVEKESLDVKFGVVTLDAWNESKIRKYLENNMKENGCVLVDITDIQYEKYEFMMDEDEFIKCAFARKCE